LKFCRKKVTKQTRIHTSERTQPHRMPNGVKKSQRTAHSAKLRAMEKQRQEDETRRKEEEAEKAILENTPYISPEKEKLMKQFANRVIADIKSNFTANVIAWEEAEKDEALKETRYATFVSRQFKTILPLIYSAVKEKKQSIAYPKSFLKKMARETVEDRTEFLLSIVDGEVGIRVWEVMLGDANLELHFNGDVGALYLTKNTTQPPIRSHLFGAQNIEKTEGDNLRYIIWRMAFYPPKIAKKNGQKWAIHIGCFGSMWIDVDYKDKQYRISVFNTDGKHPEGEKPTAVDYDKEFHPHFIIRHR
jgi:hypothetical protein